MSPIGRSKPATIAIFGASGDLTHRKLVPALHTLFGRQLLSPQTRVLGIPARNTVMRSFVITFTTASSSTPEPPQVRMTSASGGLSSPPGLRICRATSPT